MAASALGVSGDIQNEAWSALVTNPLGTVAIYCLLAKLFPTESPLEWTAIPDFDGPHRLGAPPSTFSSAIVRAVKLALRSEAARGTIYAMRALNDPTVYSDERSRWSSQHWFYYLLGVCGSTALELMGADDNPSLAVKPLRNLWFCYLIERDGYEWGVFANLLYHWCAVCHQSLVAKHRPAANQRT